MPISEQELPRKNTEATLAQKLVILGVISLVGTSALASLSATFGISLHEIVADKSDEEVKMIAVALIGLSTLLNLATEIPTLNKRGYSASPTSTTIYEGLRHKIFNKGLRRAALASLLSNGISETVFLTAGGFLTLFQSLLANRHNLAAVFSHEMGRLGWENSASILMALTTWRLLCNIPINYVDPKKLFEPAENIYYRVKPNAYAPMREVNKLDA